LRFEESIIKGVLMNTKDMYLKVGDETNTKDIPQNQTQKIKKQGGRRE
jgi:hypothetical protein